MSLSANGSAAFKWKLHCHWLTDFWQHLVTLVIFPSANKRYQYSLSHCAVISLDSAISADNVKRELACCRYITVLHLTEQWLTVDSTNIRRLDTSLADKWDKVSLIYISICIAGHHKKFVSYCVHRNDLIMKLCFCHLFKQAQRKTYYSHQHMLDGPYGVLRCPNACNKVSSAQGWVWWPFNKTYPAYQTNIWKKWNTWKIQVIYYLCEYQHYVKLVQEYLSELMHTNCIHTELALQELIHWGWAKMAPTLQTTFSKAFSYIRFVVSWLMFHWNLFPEIQLTICQHWCRWWFGAEQVTSHYLNQWWPGLVTHLCVTGPQCVNGFLCCLLSPSDNISILSISLCTMPGYSDSAGHVTHHLLRAIQIQWKICSVLIP